MAQADIRVGLIGLRHLHPRGYMASFRAVNGVQVVAAAERDDTVLKDFTKDFPLRGYGDWREMLEHERLDLAVIFLPPAECPEAAISCARSGVHILAEKPMAASPEGVRQMIAAASNARVILSVPFVWRYHVVARKMKHLCEDGTLGRIVGCEARSVAGRIASYLDGHAEWVLEKRLSGGGPMCTLGVHWIDLYRWLLDDEVVEVVGKNVKVNQEYDVEDNSFALVTFARGTVLALDVSYVPDCYPPGRELYFAARGTSGAVSWAPASEGVMERLSVWGDAPAFRSVPSGHIDFEVEAHPGYSGMVGVHFLCDLVQSIRTGSPPAVAAEDGLRSLEVVEAIYRSADSGLPVQLEPKREGNELTYSGEDSAQEGLPLTPGGQGAGR